MDEQHEGSKPIARVIAFYLPQFHPIPENDEWWGIGFTEWTAVARAKPLFRGHIQPRIPTELGFYDLRIPEVRQQQADLASEHGIEGFCYWHYWLGNQRRMLERPFAEVLESGKPDFPFCLGWANHDWKGTIFGAGKRCLLEQHYPGGDDHAAHFRFLLSAFQDRRYIRVDNKPLLYIYRPHEIPHCAAVMDIWRAMARRADLPGLYIVGGKGTRQPVTAYGLDAYHIARHRQISAFRERLENIVGKRLSPIPAGRDALLWLLRIRLKRYPYRRAIQKMLLEKYADDEIPEVTPNWDTTPRYGREAVIFTEATPELFGQLVHKAIDKIRHRPREHRIVFLKSWNEWAEGNYMEPDDEYGRGRLSALRAAILGGSGSQSCSLEMNAANQKHLDTTPFS
jgi:hypothetical protein